MIGVSQGTASQLLRGRTDFTLGELDDLCRGLGCDLLDVLGEAIARR
jgi:DNA-binding Xre family transcriptional regulator